MLKDKATKAIHGVLKKCRQNNLSMESQLNIFDLSCFKYASIWVEN